MAFKLSLEIPTWLIRVLDSPRLAAWFLAPLPPVAVEVGSRALVSVALSRNRDGSYAMERHRRIELPLGLVQPSLTGPLVSDQATFDGFFRDAVHGLPGFDGRLSVLLPDRVARITVVDLEHEAASHSETAELIRWKIKRATPFRVEDSRISYHGFRTGNGVRCLVSVVPLTALNAIERCAATLGYEAGLIDLSTFRLWNLLESALPESGDALMVNVTEDFATMLVARDRQPLFVRVKAPLDGGEMTFEAIRAELLTTILYYQDRVNGPGLRGVWLRGPAETVAGLSSYLNESHGIETRPIEAQSLGSTVAQLDPGQLSSLAPALGAAMGN